MKTEREIKVLLSGIRKPELSEDPEVQAAWNQVKDSPELLQWWEAQRNFDEEVTKALKTSDVPDDLESEILEQTTFIRHGEAKTGLRRFRGASWTGWAAAAVVVLLGGLFLFKDTLINNQNLLYLPQWSEVEKQDNFRDAMAVFVDDTLINLDFLSEDRHSIQSWLVAQGGANMQRFPESFDDLNTLGCKTLKWKEQTVSLVCFHYGDSRILHLFVLDRKGTAEALIQNLEGMQRVRNLETGGWLTPTHAVMLVGSDPDVNVEPFLKQRSI